MHNFSVIKKQALSDTVGKEVIQVIPKRAENKVPQLNFSHSLSNGHS